MRKKLIAFILLVIALSFLVIGIVEAQIGLIVPFYEDMSSIVGFGSEE